MLSKIQQIEETLTKYVRMYSVLLLCLVVASWSHSMMGGFFYPKPATVSSSQSCAFLHSAEWFAAMKSVRGGRGAAGILLTVWGPW